MGTSGENIMQKDDKLTSGRERIARRDEKKIVGLEIWSSGKIETTSL